MAPKNKWIVDTVAGATPSKKEEKLGDTVEVVGPHGGKQTIYRARMPDISDEKWQAIVDSVRPLPPEVPEDTPLPINPPSRFSDEEKAQHSVRFIDQVIAPNGATDRQVQEGGTPGTAHTKGPLAEASTSAVETLAHVANPLNVLDNSKQAYQSLIGGKAPRKDAEMPPASAASAPGSEGGAASVSIRTPGGDPGASPLEGPTPNEIMELGMARGEAEGNAAKIRAFQAGEIAKARGEEAVAVRQVAAIEDQAAADVLEQEQVRQDRLNQFKDHFSKLAAEQAKLDPTIDPNRYWKNKDAGQVALGAIAGALFGFAGKGMDYLNTIKAEVDRDVESQRTTYEQSDKKLQRQMAALGDDYARAREAGLSEKEAKAAAATMKLKAAESLVRASVANTATAEAQANAANLLAGIEPMKIGYLQEAGKAAGQAAHLRASSKAADQSSRAAMINANTNAVRASATGSGKHKVPAALVKQMQGYDEAIIGLQKMREIAGAGTLKKLNRATVGVSPGASIPGVADVNFPGFGSYSDAESENASWGINRERALVGATKASIKENDEKRLQNVLKSPNKMGSAPVKEIDSLIEDFTRQREQLKKNAEQYDITSSAPGDFE